jgi:hypothetical protein
MDISPHQPQKCSKRFFDIVPPNKTVSDTSSRPLVVTNKPKQDDPMVTPATSIPVDSPKVPSKAEGSITVAEAMEGASEPIKLDKPNDTEPAKQADSPPNAILPKAADEPEKEVELKDIPVDLPTDKSSGVIVVHHGYSAKTIRNIIKVILIVLLLIVIADIILDIGYVKLAVPHTHFFGSLRL